MRHEPVVIETFGDLAERDCYIAVWCHACPRSTRIEATAFPPGKSFVGRRWRCSVCGAPGSVTINQRMTIGGIALKDYQARK